MPVQSDPSKVVRPSNISQEDATDRIRASAAKLGIENPPHENLVKKTSETENVMTVDLPSRYLFYPQDSISFRPLKWRELILIGSAQESGSQRSIAEAVSRTVVDFPAMLLTYGDYQYAVYYHRSRMKTPWTVTWQCESQKHMEMITKEQALSDSLEQRKSVRESNLEEYYPDTKKIDELLINGKLLDKFFVSAPTVEDVITTIEESEDILERVKEDDPQTARNLLAQLSDLRMMNRYAMHLASSKHGKTLRDRRMFLERYLDQDNIDPVDVIKAFSEFEKACDHGVRETLDVKCEVCGEEQTLPVRFNPVQLFPEVQ